MHINPEARADSPNDINETPFSDDATYDAYVAIFMKFGDAAKLSSSDDVLAEYPTMLCKMRGLMQPTLWCKFDCAEAAKDLSNV